MKVWLAAFAGLILLQSGAVVAGSWRELPQLQAQPDRGDRGQHRQRDGGRPERFERQQRHQRLSDEERRDLHRDLDKARREIYRPRPER